VAVASIVVITNPIPIAIATRLVLTFWLRFGLATLGLLLGRLRFRLWLRLWFGLRLLGAG
jgi:hypothetical protein